MNRYFHTVKRLRWEQILYRLKYRLQRWAKPELRISETSKPHAPGTFQTLQRYQDALHCPFQASTLKKGIFDFIQIREAIGFPPQWDFKSDYKLWRYQLHYFDWIWALDFQDAKNCVQDWIETYGYKSHRDGWEAYPTSLRLVNWGIYFLTKHTEQVTRSTSFQTQLLTSMHIQANWLANRLEFHLMANHLFENAAALTLLGCLLEGSDCKRWHTKGLQLLIRETREQILPDGGHYERSPMYHLRMLHLLKYVTLSHPGHVPDVLRQAVVSMENAFEHMCHPDGDIALFNDAAIDVYPLPPAFDKEQGQKQTSGAWKLEHTGYYGYRNTDGDYVIVDAGELGPSYNPGHAHADLFSYELSYDHKRLIVDSGNFDYEPGAMRDYCRSTKAHNTVEINDADQCHFWGTFRVAESASPKEVFFEDSNEGFELNAWHDGYHRLRTHATHRRSIRFAESTGMLVKDHIQAQMPVKAVSRIHFHPECEISGLTDTSIEISRGNITTHIRWDEQAKAELTDSYYCPRFNESKPNKCLSLMKSGRDISIDYTIGPKMQR